MVEFIKEVWLPITVLLVMMLTLWVWSEQFHEDR